MLKNYFKIAWRSLTHHKSYSIINIAGLAVGMCCCILIGLYMREELSFDRFHKNSDRMVAIGTEHPYFGKILNTPYPLKDALSDNIPEVEKATRIATNSLLRISSNQENFIEIEHSKYAEPSFFDVFSYELISGNKWNALQNPKQIVLTESISDRLFGKENPLGKTISWAQRDTLIYLEVSGVIENPPRNTAIPFEALLSFSTLPENRRPLDGWGMYSFNTYVLLNSPASNNILAQKTKTITAINYEEEYRPSFFGIPINDLHLSEFVKTPGFTGNAKYLYFFGSIAVFILFIACVNYVNLATARISKRSKEVGIRKTLGAERKQIAWQFLGESVLLCMGAYVLSVSLAGFALPFFNQLFGTQLIWEQNRFFLLMLGLSAIFIGLIAGLYPALYLSRFSPSAILKDKFPSGLSESLMRKILVVSQFSIALVLIIGSLVIFKQLQFTQTKDLGFEGEQVMVVNLPNKQTWNLRNTITDDFKSYPGIIQATAADALPGGFGIAFGMSPNDLSPQNKVPESEKDSGSSITLFPAVVDYNFLSTLDIELITGRNFSSEYPSDFEHAYIINEKTAEVLGWTPEEAIGKTYGIKKEGTVIGVVENFHLQSLHEDISPVSLQLHEGASWSNNGLIAVKIAPDNIPGIINDLEKVFSEYAPHQPFNFEFLDDKFDAMYRTERRLGQITGLFTAIAIFIACLGLFGLAAFSAERRTKEIGIRKVLGASVANIVTLLSKDFVLLVIIGFIIGSPIAWYAMNQWLADFVFRIEIGPDIFALAGALALMIALLTVSWQSLKAASMKPVDSLRNE